MTFLRLLTWIFFIHAANHFTNFAHKSTRNYSFQSFQLFSTLFSLCVIHFFRLCSVWFKSWTKKSKSHRNIIIRSAYFLRNQFFSSLFISDEFRCWFNAHDVNLFFSRLTTIIGFEVQTSNENAKKPILADVKIEERKEKTMKRKRVKILKVITMIINTVCLFLLLVINVVMKAEQIMNRENE